MDTQKALDTACTSHDADSMNCIQDTPSMTTPSSVLAAPCKQGEGGVSHSWSSSMSTSSIMPGSSKSTSSCSGNHSWAKKRKTVDAEAQDGTQHPSTLSTTKEKHEPKHNLLEARVPQDPHLQRRGCGGRPTSLGLPHPQSMACR
jgi:hypothetical protein